MRGYADPVTETHICDLTGGIHYPPPFLCSSVLPLSQWLSGSLTVLKLQATPQAVEVSLLIKAISLVVAATPPGLRPGNSSGIIQPPAPAGLDVGAQAVPEPSRPSLN